MWRTDAEKARYAAYLRGPAWRGRRNAIMRLAGGICEYMVDGGRRCTARATQCHHLTYDRIFNELPGDLMALCDFHHRTIHVLDLECERCHGKVFRRGRDAEAFVRWLERDGVTDLPAIRKRAPHMCNDCVNMFKGR